MLLMFSYYFYLESFPAHVHAEDPKSSLSITGEFPFKYYFCKVCHNNYVTITKHISLTRL